MITLVYRVVRVQCSFTHLSIHPSTIFVINYYITGIVHHWGWIMRSKKQVSDSSIFWSSGQTNTAPEIHRKARVVIKAMEGKNKELWEHLPGSGGHEEMVFVLTSARCDVKLALLVLPVRSSLALTRWWKWHWGRRGSLEKIVGR